MVFFEFMTRRKSIFADIITSHRRDTDLINISGKGASKEVVVNFNFLSKPSKRKILRMIEVCEIVCERYFSP